MNEYFDQTLSSNSSDESEAWLAAAYGRVKLDHRFTHFDERMVGDKRFLLTNVHLRGICSCTVDPDVVVVAAATGFGWDLDRETGSLAAEPALFQPQHPYTAAMEDTRIEAVALQPEELRRTARLLYAQDDLELRFDGPHPASPAAAAQWLAALRLAQGLQRDGVLENDLIRASTFRLLAVAALESFRLVGDRRGRRVTAARRRQVYRTGSEFLDAFASLPVTIDDAAAAAGASVPELVQAFRAHAPRSSSPTAYLRRVRLDAAMIDLRAAEPTGDETVRRVALRWGFPSPKRFATAFRPAFGVSPQRVLAY